MTLRGEKVHANLLAAVPADGRDARVELALADNVLAPALPAAVGVVKGFADVSFGVLVVDTDVVGTPGLEGDGSQGRAVKDGSHNEVMIAEGQGLVSSSSSCVYFYLIPALLPPPLRCQSLS